MSHPSPLELLAIGGTVVGADHRRALRNNQDGMAFAQGDGWHVVVVTDGCSSGRASEVGARLGAAYLAARTLDVALRARIAEETASGVAAAALAWMDGIASSFGDARRKDAIADMLLFTFLVAAVGPERALVFGVGDGVVSLNGVTLALDAGHDNAPPYLAYGLLGPAPVPVVHVDVPAADIRTLAVATDGAVELVARAGESLDGAPQRGLDQFEDERAYLKNPSLLQKRLVVIGERHGRLHDDTTIGLLRRREAPPCVS